MGACVRMGRDDDFGPSRKGSTFARRALRGPVGGSFGGALSPRGDPHRRRGGAGAVE